MNCVASHPSIKTKEFDPKTHQTPIDRIAARVIGRGVNYTYVAPDVLGVTKDLASKIIAQRHWFSPPRIARPPYRDLTGKRFGRFTVIGFLPKATSAGKNATGMWLVRCICGDYETRKSKSINNPNNSHDACERCRHLAFLKKDHAYRTTGEDLDIKHFL